MVVHRGAGLMGSVQSAVTCRNQLNIDSQSLADCCLSRRVAFRPVANAPRADDAAVMQAKSLMPVVGLVTVAGRLIHNGIACESQSQV